MFTTGSRFFFFQQPIAATFDKALIKAARTRGIQESPPFASWPARPRFLLEGRIENSRKSHRKGRISRLGPSMAGGAVISPPLRSGGTGRRHRAAPARWPLGWSFPESPAPCGCVHAGRKVGNRRRPRKHPTKEKNSTTTGQTRKRTRHRP